MNGIGRLAIIGAGAMGSAFAEGVLAAGIVCKAELILADADPSALKKASDTLGAQTTADNAAAAGHADTVILAVKPGLVKAVLDDIREYLDAGKLLISIAAGVRIETIESSVPEGVPVIRAMPNTPCRIRQGAVGFSRGSAALDKHVQVAAAIFNAVGLSVEVPERLLNAVTGLSGSGPAYVFVIIEALSDAGVRVGLPRDVSIKLAAQTVSGAARMLLELDEHPGRLKDQVTSPGGTTIAGLDALERAGFRSALIEAVKAAVARAEELG